MLSCLEQDKSIYCRSVFYNFIFSWFDLFVITWHRKGLSMFLLVTVRDFREKFFNIKFLIAPWRSLASWSQKQWFAISQAFTALFLIKLYFLKTYPIVRKAAKVHTWDIKKRSWVSIVGQMSRVSVLERSNLIISHSVFFFRFWLPQIPGLRPHSFIVLPPCRT